MPTLSQFATWFIVIALISSSAVSDGDLISGSGATPDVDIGSIDENYWGGEDPSTDDSKVPDIDYTVSNISGWTNTFSFVFCGTGLDFGSSPIGINYYVPILTKSKVIRMAQGSGNLRMTRVRMNGE